MAVIEATDLAGSDNLALRVLTVARTIAPTLDDLTGTPREAAIAILRGVLKEATVRGSRNVASKRTGPSSINYRDAESWFTAEDRRALRGLCGIPDAPSGSAGSFPRPAAHVGNMWPEGDYS